jgi:hypothetical protein
MAVNLLFLSWSLMIASRLMLLVTLLVLLGLGATLLIGLFVEGRDEVLEGPDKMYAEVTFGFVGLFNRFGDILNGCGEAFEGGVDALEARGDAFEEFGLMVVF